MIEAPETTSTRPYLIRALYEWCTDNGFTPYLAVSVDDRVQVPREYVKECEIVLNISFDATSSLKLGNDFIEFKGRFAGTARDIMVPVGQVIAIYARENGQGMAFPLGPSPGERISATSSINTLSVRDGTQAAVPEAKVFQLTSVESEPRNSESNPDPDPPRPLTTGPRPALKRVK